MGDFLDVADNLWKSDRVKEKSEFYKIVFSAIGRLQAVHSKAQLDLNNIESVFNALEMARILGKFPGSQEVPVESAIEALKQLIASTLEQTLVFPVHSQRVTPPKPYQAFADLIRHLRSEAHPQRAVAVLTFNYDLAADYAFHINGLGPSYCLDSKDSKGVPLLKLHGSMNWAVCAKCAEVIPWHLNEFFKTFNYNFLHDAQEVRFDVWSKFAKFSHCDTSVSSLPFLVPPTWNKTDHQETIRAVWQRAAQELTTAEHIFIIGYSLPETDAFFRTLYALGVVGDMPLKRIWVYNPDSSGGVEQRFRLLIGPGAAARFRYFQMTFGDAITHIKQEFPGRK